MKILALQLKRIGDAILTAPALADVKAANPESQLTLILAGATGDLAPAFTAADEVIVYHKRRPDRNLKIWARSAVARSDLCLDFTGSDRSAIIAAVSGAERRIGYKKFLSGTWRERVYTELNQAAVRDLHTMDFHRALGGFPNTGRTGFEPPTCSVPPGVRGPQFAVVHPGTARTEKYWYADRWAGVIRSLVEQQGLPVVLTGSDDPEEQAHIASIRAGCSVPVTDLTGALSLLELASLVRGAELVLSVDSAAAHFAALAATPQITLFGPTNPFHWRPRHEHAIVLNPGTDGPVLDFSPRVTPASMRGISTAAVIRAIGILLSR